MFNRIVVLWKDLRYALRLGYTVSQMLKGTVDGGIVSFNDYDGFDGKVRGFVSRNDNMLHVPERRCQ